MEKIMHYINGAFHEPENSAYLDNYQPATGKVYSKIAKASASDVDKAVNAATAAFKAWRSTPAHVRSAFLLEIANHIQQNLEEFAQAESKDNGKPISLARQIDIPRAISNFQFFAAASTQFSSESHYTEKIGINYTLRQPLGAVGCISPWNLPLYLFTWKIAPALAAGNTVVAKPS
ncbi:MAG: aldehyde dehydrogenase family protein, partial [Bacteroidetes bacterium]|nr:aldehyde dehydrogenase family protein [Bacteroidota bacterium]